jgi:CheY-like chemotaxis protein
MMGGKIWCESTLGQGSSFFFTVRLKIADKKEQSQSQEVSFKGLTALIVDDDITALEIISEELIREAFEVITCASGMEAIDYLDSKKWFPDLLVIDWQMPNMDGLDTIKKLQAKWTRSRQVPIIMVTAYNRDEVLPFSRSLGVKKVLDKPISASKLHDTLMELFGRKLVRTTQNDLVSEKELIKTIKGARILLVEDNDVNQLVAGRILGNAGFKVKIAGNGSLAVDMVKNEPFELILMDIQMPVMDGFTATHHIRELGFRDLPIVAMTAHAMSSDRELSLKSGMNDHINKPINVQELFQTLLKWIPPQNNETPETKPLEGE